MTDHTELTLEMLDSFETDLKTAHWSIDGKLTMQMAPRQMADLIAAARAHLESKEVLDIDFITQPQQREEVSQTEPDASAVEPASPNRPNVRADVAQPPQDFDSPCPYCESRKQSEASVAAPQDELVAKAHERAKGTVYAKLFRELADRIEQLEATARDNYKHYQATIEQKHFAEADNTQLRLRIEQLEAENERLYEERKALKALKGISGGLWNAAETEVERMEMLRDWAEAERDMAQRDLASVQAEYAVLSDERNTLRARVKQLEEALENIVKLEDDSPGGHGYQMANRPWRE